MARIELNKEDTAYFPQGFQVSLNAWREFALDGVAPAVSETMRGAERVRLARVLAENMNAKRDFSRPKTQPARAGELLAMGLLQDILRYLTGFYCTKVVPAALKDALEWTRERAAPIVVDRSTAKFVDLYPPGEVRTERVPGAVFLSQTRGPLSNIEHVARELILLRLSMDNSALGAYLELFDDTDLKIRAPYVPLVEHLAAYFQSLPVFPGTQEPLWDLLTAPMRACPDSIMAQLDFIRLRWAEILSPELLERLAVAQGILREETQMRGFGPGEAQALDFAHLRSSMGYEEFEAFSVDKDWMPNLVLIAKTVYVWLDQMSKRHRREIRRLDQIPNEELDRLAHWGFTGLWLIGVWERSCASETIKKRMGNPEAASSAYSLYDYVIAEDLGGEAAYQDLAGRAWKRGIRLASDMVPNHVGLYSKWVIEHPDWFIQLPYPPYPSYQFNGPDLSPDGRVGLFIEDGYWNHSDAAVVFKRVDRHTGDTRYIYHGNDGTHMPWNDTAQLNYLLPEVRETVIQTILHVARKFSVIRFDAAMTLAKKHYQRLWFPQPEDAGAIPSRAEHGMDRPSFDAAFPAEFWREVVDRVAAEAPDTLLLAEAFWLMEGYFVRTLGMHRVYNSAFMNMLKMEDNLKYRLTIKNVLEFSPEILQRFVNFMNNPDEDTAEAQFGKGDKYFGVAVLMSTMPGLPMFGHGQIEGFTEKYGMEYRRAYWDEQVDEGLVARHEREIFPLMRLRRVFSGAANFALFDFVTFGGGVDENVFAYANRAGRDRAFVLYNNAYNTTHGTLRLSSAVNTGTVDHPILRRVTLADALALNPADTCYYIVRGHRSGLEYLHYAPDLIRDGMTFDLLGYQYEVLLDWRERHDFDRSWGRLHGELAGRGVSSVDEAYMEMHLDAILQPFRRLMTAETFVQLTGEPPEEAAFQENMQEFLEAVGQRCGQTHDPEPLIADMLDEIESVRDWPQSIGDEPLYPEMVDFLDRFVPKKAGLAFWRVPIAWAMMRNIGAMAAPEPGHNGFDATATSGAWLREWLLTKQIARAFVAIEEDHWAAEMDARLVRICVAFGRDLSTLQYRPWAPILDRLFTDPQVREYLNAHTFGGRLWIVKEQLERMLGMMLLTRTVELTRLDGEAAADALMFSLDDIRTILDAAQDVGYDLDALVEILR